MKRALLIAFILVIGAGAMETGLCADALNDLRLQSTSNLPIIFINGYWIKPVYTEKEITGFAFIPHAAAVQNGMKTVAQITAAYKGFDNVAEDLSHDILAAHAKRRFDPIVVVDLEMGLGDWWESAIDAGLPGGGFDDSGWWKGIGDGLVFGNDLMGGDTSGIDSEGNWWDEGETVYFSDDPINTNFDTGEDDSQPGEDDFKPHDPDEEWWRDDDEEEEEEEEENGIIHCPPPGLCFQTETIETLGFDHNLVWDSVNIILNTIMAEDAANAITYAPAAKGQTDMSLVLLPAF